MAFFTAVSYTHLDVYKRQALRLLHANANHAKKMPYENPQSKIFENCNQTDHMLYPADASKLTIRNLSGSIHYLLTDEILFMKANNKILSLIHI